MDKLVSGLKDVPLWGLIAFAIIMLAVLGFPQLQAGLPPTARAMTPLAATGLLIVALCGSLARASSVWTSARSREAVHGRAQLLNIYRPIMTLFLDRHVTVSCAIGAPRLADRVRNAVGVMRARRRSAFALGPAIRALGDRRVSSRSEVEFGGEFPLGEITAIAKGHPAEADPQLLRLLGRADRARCETPVRPGQMTDEDLALYEFVQSRHDRLSRLT